MAHPCSSPRPPAWCNRKRSKRKTKKSCACPAGWTSKGIICQKGSQRKMSSCAKRRR